MNTGAILNRINFGLSVAAGQLPTARLTNWPLFDSLRALPRDKQVDGVIKSMLGGQVSPETRQVLLSGDNPMLSKGGAANDVNGMAIIDSSAVSMAARGQPARQAAKGEKDGKGFPRVQLPGFGRSVDLKGLPQVVGLALGAPEFQRR